MQPGSQAVLLCQPFPRSAALGVLEKELRRHRGAAPLLGDPAHGDPVLEGTEPEPDPVARLDGPRPLRLVSVDFDLPAFDRLRGLGPRLEEARGPEPFIEARR